MPGYWGLQGDTRVWVASDWSLSPLRGWAWVVPHWAWNGYQWVWQEGHWAPAGVLTAASSRMAAVPC